MGAESPARRPRQMGAYDVEDELGRGGMGVVLRARHRALDRPTVLKRLRPDLAEEPELLARFEREARAAAALHHPNTVTVYDFFVHRGDHYIALELVDGADLRGVLGRCGALPWRIAAAIGLEAARGLEAIHAAGTVHRDLKPANLLLGRRGEVKIGDFGIALEATGAALTRPGILVGSPPYMPPEQLRGERLDARGDVFGLGVLLYEMLAGEPPYHEPRDDDADTWLTQMERERYVSLRRAAPEAPRFLRRLVRDCLRAVPRRRPASGGLVRRALEAGLRGPAPEELRAELAGWLWEHQVWEARKGETVVLVRPAPGGAPRPRRGWIPAALAVGLGLSVLLVDVRPDRDAAPPTTEAGAGAEPGAEPDADSEDSEAPVSREAGDAGADPEADADGAPDGEASPSPP